MTIYGFFFLVGGGGGGLSSEDIVCSSVVFGNDVVKILLVLYANQCQIRKKQLKMSMWSSRSSLGLQFVMNYAALFRSRNVGVLRHFGQRLVAGETLGHWNFFSPQESYGKKAELITGQPMIKKKPISSEYLQATNLRTRGTR